MPESKLPLKIRIGIRDHFEAPTCLVQQEFHALETTVGLKVYPTIEWEMLWAELSPNFPDAGVFVPNVAGVIEKWCFILRTRLDEEAFASSTEELVGKLESAGRTRLRVEMTESSRPKIAWISSSSTFVLSFPRETPFSPTNCISGLQTDLEDLFAFASLSSQTPDKPDKDDGWAAIDESGETQSISFQTTQHPTQSDAFPSLATLPSPEVLLRTLTPYILHVTCSSPSKLVVHGTHEPSLQLLSEYLQRWTRRNHQDSTKSPLLRTTLHESAFGLGLYHDTLTIEPYSQLASRYVQINPALVLAFVGSVLGYERVAGGAGTHGMGFWEFRRDVGFG